MTRKSKRELERALDHLQGEIVDEDDETPPLIVFAGGGADEFVLFVETEIEDPPTLDVGEITIRHEMAEAARGDYWEQPTFSNLLPGWFPSGVVCVSELDALYLWETMPKELRTEERAYREQHDYPIPPLLKSIDTAEG